MPPFSGPTCAEQDPCSPNPVIIKFHLKQHYFNSFILIKCQNGGHCMNNGYGYQCRCQTGFTGRNCEQSDICNVKNPCLCGTCQSDASHPLGFRCHCPQGYSGQRCERLLNCLDPGMECRNGGYCIPRVLGDYVCSCPQPWCGSTCTNTMPSCK